MTRIQVSPNLSVADLLSQLGRGETLLLEDRPGHPVAAVSSPDDAIKDEAEKMFGVRPKTVKNGRPIFDEEDMRNPAFRECLPEEPPEVLEQWRKDCEAWEAGNNGQNS